MAEVILAAAKAFEAPATPASVSDTAPLRSEGAVMMDRIFVKSSPLRRDQVRPPDLSLLTFHDLKRDDRRATGISATLFRVLSGNGEINLNILNGAGQGVDHGRDFTRFELEFKLRF